MLEIRYHGFTFNESQIRANANIYRVISLLGDSLESDIFTFTVKSSAIGEQRIWTRFHEYLVTASNEIFVVDDGDLSEFNYGDPVYVYNDGEQKAVFYITNIILENAADDGDEFFTIQCSTVIGLLSRMKHSGGVYENEPAGNIITDIVRGLPISVAPDVAAVPVYGWLPYTKDARANLQQVLFAVGASVVRAADGTAVIVFNQPTEAKEIPTERTVRTGLFKKHEQATKITLVEHAYYVPSQNVDNEEVVFDNTVEALGSQRMIVFDKPYVSYRGVGITVDTANSGANYATISGVGVLYGKPYIHVSREITRELPSNGQPLEIGFRNATLVSSINSAGIADRLENYYTNAVVRKATFQVEGELPGDLVKFYDRRGEARTGYIRNIDETKTSFWLGNAEIVTDWVPQTPGNDYDSYLVITESDIVNGVWTPSPELVGKRARLVLFSGAEGGEGGHAGLTPGTATGSGAYGFRIDSDSYVGAAGEQQTGGEGGEPGRGGAAATKILNVDIDSLASSYNNVHFGIGGEGGAGGTTSWYDPKNVGERGYAVIVEPELGSPGGDTTFGIWNTLNGATFRGIYVNMVTGEVLADTGGQGYKGGNGGRGGLSNPGINIDDDVDGFDYANIPGAKGENGQNVLSYTGGIGANGVTGNKVRFMSGPYYHVGNYAIQNGGGGGGGGAAMGASGGTGSQATTWAHSWKEDDERYHQRGVNEATYHYGDEGLDLITYSGAAGGNGATATLIPDRPLYTGGIGGHGGGGGGGAGQSLGSMRYDAGNNVHHSGDIPSGLGGNGGKGGPGSNGFALLYYKA